MTISSVSSLSSLASAAAASSASASSSASQTSALGLDFTEYLKILTTQLQNQDPTNATDPNQYTQELIQMEQVQAQITNNSDLQGLTNATAANGLATGVSYIGSYVRASTGSGEFSLEEGATELGYTLASAASSTTVNIEDSNGNVIAQLSGGTAAGDNYITWDGSTSSGTTAPDGTYTFSVVAQDNAANSIKVTNPTAFFFVTGVQTNSDGTLQLDAGSLSLSSSDVTGVYAASTLPGSTKGTLLSSS